LIAIDNVTREVLQQFWYLLNEPWVESDLSGMTIYAGSPDPHIGVLVCDVQDCFGATMDDDAARLLAKHIAEVHNEWLRK
jgi:hypothetical protein